MNPDPGAPPAAAETRAEEISTLFREHNRALVNFLLTRLHDEQEAKEAAQEAYVKLLQLDQTVASGFLRWYLFKIARCIAVDRQRRNAVRSRVGRLEVFEDLGSSDPTAGRAMAADELARLRSAFEELPGKHRQAFALQRFQGLSTTQIAARMGVTDRMIRHYVRRSLIYCRVRLEGASPEDARRQAQL